MEWNGDGPTTYSCELQNVMGNRKFLSKNYLERLYSGREGIVNRIMTRRRSLVKLQLRRGSKEEDSSLIQQSKVGIRKSFSTGNACQLSQIDLEESGYLEVFPEEKLIGNTISEYTPEHHPIDEDTDGEYDAQYDTTRDSIGKCDELNEDTIGNGMNNVSKKLLTLSVSSSICSDESSLEGDLSHDHSRLTTVLNSIDPKRLHNYLKRKLEQKDSTTIHALGTLLPKKRFKGETQHCVRCHKEFDPKHGEKTCELYHQKDDVMMISEDNMGADFACERCGSVFRIDGKWKYKESLNRKHNCGPCFTGVHTISTDEVLQENNGISKSCEDYGCIVFYV